LSHKDSITNHTQYAESDRFHFHLSRWVSIIDVTSILTLFILQLTTVEYIAFPV